MRQHHTRAALLLGVAVVLLAPAAAPAQFFMRPGYGGYAPYGWGYSPWSAGYPNYYPGATYGNSWSDYPANAPATYAMPSYSAGNTTFTPAAIAQSAHHSNATTVTQPAAPGYAASEATAPPPAGEAPRVEGTNTAQVNVRVPEGDAQVWIEGQLMQQKGARREFISPVLTTGRNYNYEIRARWTENGRTSDETRTVPVRANQVVNVDFGAAAANASRVEELGNQPRPPAPAVNARFNNTSRIDEIAAPAKPPLPAAKPPADGSRPERQ